MDVTPGGHPLPLLQLSPEEMRQLGYQVVDAVVEHLVQLPETRVANVATREHLEGALGMFSDEPQPPSEVLDLVRREVMASVSHVDHPRFFAFVPGTGNFVGTMADTLAAGYNVFAGHWLAASGPAAVELQTIAFLCRECGLPEGAGGLFVSGGSMANLSALATARRVCLGGPDATAVAYCSDQTHNSLAKGLRVLGFADDQLRTVATDGELRLSVPHLVEAIVADRAAGRKPFCVIANAGTTNTGAVDPLNAIADLCAAESLWLHVDGAYGAAAVLTPEGRELLTGLGRADSITLDPHKWLFQPFEVGCVLVRDLRHLRVTFSVHAEDHSEYLKDVQRVVDKEMIFFEHGVQLTRSFRALKVWMTLRVFGVRAMREAIAYGIRLGEMAERHIRADDRFEIVTPAQLGVVTFAPTGARGADGDELVRRVVEGIIADGYAMLTATSVHKRVVLRICAINPATTDEDLKSTVRRVGDITSAVRAGMEQETGSSKWG